MKILTRLAFLTFVCVLPIAIKAQTQPPGQTRLHDVQSIYIEDLGGSDEAARFKLLIEGELSNKGFKIVDSAKQADATLSGVISLVDPGYYFRGTNDISVTLKLAGADGSRLWTGNSAGQIRIYNPIRAQTFDEPVAYRARELAKKLRDEWQKSAKRRTK